MFFIFHRAKIFYLIFPNLSQKLFWEFLNLRHMFCGLKTYPIIDDKKRGWHRYLLSICQLGHVAKPTREKSILPLSIIIKVSFFSSLNLTKSQRRSTTSCLFSRQVWWNILAALGANAAQVGGDPSSLGGTLGGGVGTETSVKVPTHSSRWWHGSCGRNETPDASVKLLPQGRRFQRSSSTSGTTGLKPGRASLMGQCVSNCTMYPSTKGVGHHVYLISPLVRPKGM